MKTRRVLSVNILLGVVWGCMFASGCELLTPAVRPGDCWHFSEVVEWLASLPGDLTLERIRGQSRPPLQYQIVGDGVPVFKLVINLTQDRCWITLSAKQLPDSFHLVEKRMIAIPGKVYRTAGNVYELESGAVQLNLMITQLANSMLMSETGVERNMAMWTLRRWQWQNAPEKLVRFEGLAPNHESKLVKRF